MGKRILPFGAGLLAGVALTLCAGWSIFPDRELSRAADYVRDVMQKVNRSYVDPKPAGYENLTHAALHGLVESLDPHSEYYEAKDFSDLKEDLSGEFGGVGIQVELRNGRAVVVAPIAGTPGARAGIRRGDEIVSIDGRPVAPGAGMDDIVERLRGKAGTRVGLGLLRPDTGRRWDLALTREVIKVDSVTGARVLSDGIGYIQITEFSDHTGDQFIDALNRLLKRDIAGLIIDLRDNPGGLLDSAVDVAETFFKKGDLIVYTQGRQPSDHEEFRSASDDPPLDLPVAVLVNSGTASAAEILSGALKDTGKAVIVGERSFGKGLVQSIIELRDGDGMSLTTARYYTPSGISIQEKGIRPQVEVVMTVDEDSKLRLQNSRPEITDPAEFKRQFGFAPVEDRQLEAAQDVLRGVMLLDDQARAAAKPAAGR